MLNDLTIYMNDVILIAWYFNTLEVTLILGMIIEHI